MRCRCCPPPRAQPRGEPMDWVLKPPGPGSHPGRPVTLRTPGEAAAGPRPKLERPVTCAPCGRLAGPLIPKRGTRPSAIERACSLGVFWGPARGASILAGPTDGRLSQAFAHHCHQPPKEPALWAKGVFWGPARGASELARPTDERLGLSQPEPHSAMSACSGEGAATSAGRRLPAAGGDAPVSATPSQARRGGRSRARGCRCQPLMRCIAGSPIRTEADSLARC